MFYFWISPPFLLIFRALFLSNRKPTPGPVAPSVLHFTAHFSAVYPYNRVQPVRLLLWKWTLGVNKEVKHKHCELKQRSGLWSARYCVFGPTWVTKPPSFHLSRPARFPVWSLLGLSHTRSLNGLIIPRENMFDPLNTKASDSATRVSISMQTNSPRRVDQSPFSFPSNVFLHACNTWKPREKKAKWKEYVRLASH